MLFILCKRHLLKLDVSLHEGQILYPLLLEELLKLVGVDGVELQTV